MRLIHTIWNPEEKLSDGPWLTPLPEAPVLRDQVFERLEELIITRGIKPGQRLLESELAAKLGVSRNPVREALTLLAKSGWVDLRPRHAAVVHEPTPKEIEDFFQIRHVLKSEAARLAAERGSEHDMRSMRVIIDQGLLAVERGDLHAVSELNSSFHGLVNDAGGNKVLTEVLGLMRKRLHWYLSPVAQARGRQSWEEYERLLDAIERGDGESAARIMKGHTEGTAELYRSMLSSS